MASTQAPHLIASPPEPPSWPRCAHGADPAGDEVGCLGRRVDPYGACLAHLTNADRAEYLDLLRPGNPVDLSGTTLTDELLRALLGALHDPATGHARLGTARFVKTTFAAGARFVKTTFASDARFDEATFVDHASFDWATFAADACFAGTTFAAGAWFDQASFLRVTFARATFSESASFNRATSSGSTNFSEATFAADAEFDHVTFAMALFDGVAFSSRASFSRASLSDYITFRDATFSGDAQFIGTTFAADAGFARTTFSAAARFLGATFTADAEFTGAQFSADTELTGTQFSADARFDRVRFRTSSALGPLACAGTLDLAEAVFDRPVTITAATTRLHCHRTHWGGKTTLRLRYATVDLSDAILESKVMVAARPAPFTKVEEHVASSLASHGPGVQLASLSGADAAHLVLTDVDLRGCRFTGTIHLDQLRLEGECPLASSPTGLQRHGRVPVRWTARRTLAEEQHWRASRGATGWTPAPPEMELVGPAALAPVYRQLRKSLEDGKNEPDAADFYYGEMEMRRNDPARPRAERALLAVYWAVSGYGLRASRALAWLLAAVSATLLTLTLWGLPMDTPQPETNGQMRGHSISLTTDTPAPVNPTGPLQRRITGRRFEQALRVTANSVIFRSSGQGLTTAGTYIEMVSRLLEPLLLGLAALAVRSRIKR